MVLEVRGLSSGKALTGVSFAVHRGEIVGLAGLPDAGRDELVDCLFGLRPVESGQILIGGEASRIVSPTRRHQPGAGAGACRPPQGRRPAADGSDAEHRGLQPARGQQGRLSGSRRLNAT